MTQPPSSPKPAVARIQFGATIVEGEELILTTSIEDLARARFQVRLPADEGADPEYLAIVKVSIDEDEVFEGNVLTARPVGTGIRIRCASGVELTEGLMGPLALEDVSPQDVVFAAARAAGFPESRLAIHGLDDLPLEPIEVVVPVMGVQCDTSVWIGSVRLVAPEVGHRALLPFHSLPEELGTGFRTGDAYAIILATERRLYDAELRALREVQLALAWLTVRARYGSARMPDGQAQRFDRDRARALPQLGNQMAVRGLRSGRRWVREPHELFKHPDLQVDPANGDLWPPPDPRMTSTDRQALLAAARMMADGDLVQRVAAMWEAWEFYAAPLKPSPIISKPELERLRDELPEWLSDMQRQRAQNVLGRINDPPLMRRIREALDLDGAVLRSDEWDALGRLRRLRNAATHGSATASTAQEDLDLAASLVSRAIVHRMVRLNDQRQDPAR